MARSATSASLILALLVVFLLPGAPAGAKTRTPKKVTKKAVQKSTPVKKKATPVPTPAPTPLPMPIPQLAPGELPLAAQGVFLIDALTGESLYQKNPDQVFYPASTTKILTALLVIEAGDLDRTVTIEPADTKVEPSAL